MNDVKPLLSIIIPIYNVESELKECLESVYAISTNNYEVILINDGSTDNSLEIAQVFKNRYPIITTLINQENTGLSAARNKGLSLVSGTWIAFLDSDDFIDPKEFELVLKRVEMTKADVVTFDGYRYIDESKLVLPLLASTLPFHEELLIDSRQYLSAVLALKMTNIVTVWDKLYKKELLERLHLSFMENHYHEDIPFTLTLFLAGVNVEYCDAKVIYYRQRTGSIMHSVNPKKLDSRLFIVDYLLEQIDENSVNDVNINGYIVFMLRGILEKKGKVDKKTLTRTWHLKLSVKKRVLLLFLIVKNLKTL